LVQLLVATTPRMSLPSESAISAPTTKTTPTMNAIDFAPQWIGEPSRSRRPAAAKATQVQPLPSMPMKFEPSTVPLGASKPKLRLAKMKPSTPSASEAMPITATGPLARETPLRALGVSSYLSVAMVILLEALLGAFPPGAALKRGRQRMSPCGQASFI
jgi:hypothetical protein